MCALLKQLCSTDVDEPVKEPVVQSYEARRIKADKDCSAIKRLSIEDCTQLIVELTKDCPAVFIVDALDECEVQVRNQLLEAFDIIIERSPSLIKIFVSSRDDIDIVSFPNLAHLTNENKILPVRYLLSTNHNFIEITFGALKDCIHKRKEK